VGPLRAFTLQDFDGRKWQRTEEAELTGWASEELLSSDAALVGTTPNADLGTLARVDVTIGALREQRLPVSTFPRTVEVGGSWLYDAARDEVIGERTTTTDMSYEMTVQVPAITADSLRRNENAEVRGLDDFLVVPATEHSDEMRALALEITTEADGRYEQALALQSYLRDAQNFQYDTRVAPAQSDDAVWDFLETRRGYCVQFATAMSMLARTLGIPARLGVGFLPGTPDQDRVYTVTGKQSHAWPELYFPGTGWVRFEPTPAVQSGAPPVWSDPLVFATTAPNAPGFTAAPGATAGATSTQTSGPLSAGPDTDEGVPAELVPVGVLVLLALAAAGTALVARRGRGTPPLTAESAWGRLRARLTPFDIVWTDAQTPRQVVEIVRRRVVELRGEPLTDAGDAALLGLATEVQRDRYAPRPSTVPPEELESWVGRVLADVTRAVDTAPVEPGTRTAP
jgi:transglutaminase-like putative cysteine protease